ncbi:PREDICTED: membrane magnesium transporter 1 [Papilio xuthus]|uniref:Membrane magnesium transporter n=1 Tax=Papilio xuthus TaxID=66420 RepID=I4DL04_PAPXU|nr:membrane magnesium transporter 1 [Papilio xuthus]KPI98483.1 Membrane magnesium transporter 1 [Papilio xuthus]BAM18594.1 similar to CG15168 [Papilio xuthus]
MDSSIHRIIVLVGFISLFHSAFSAAQHRTYLRITSQEFTTLPLDIVLQAVLSLFAVMWGVLNVAGNLREIPAAAELNNTKWETQRNLPSFYIFNHRGRALACNYVPSPSKSDLDNLE